MIRRAIQGAAVSALALALATGTAVPAQAASRDGRCDQNEFCLFYNSDTAGSVSDFGGSLRSLAEYGTNPQTCYVFKGAGNGRGECIKNNAASVWNRTDGPVRVYYHSGFSGKSQTVAAGFRGNLDAGLKNENASHRPVGTVTPPVDPPAGSYGKPRNNPHSAGRVTAPKATARTQFVDDEIARMTGERQCGVGGFRGDPTSDHDTGNALDCLISTKYRVEPTAAQREQGWKLANWLRTYAARLDVQYVIWDKKIWNISRADEGWRPYTRLTGVTGGHLDHVHVSMQR